MEFRSKYANMTVYIDGKPVHFRNGRYVTEDAAEIAVLSVISDCEAVEPAKVEKTEEPAPAPKAPRKSSGK